MEEYLRLLAELKLTSDTMVEIAEEAKRMVDKLREIRRRSEETEKLVGECLKLLGE